MKFLSFSCTVPCLTFAEIKPNKNKSTVIFGWIMSIRSIRFDICFIQQMNQCETLHAVRLTMIHQIERAKFKMSSVCGADKSVAYNLYIVVISNRTNQREYTQNNIPYEWIVESKIGNAYTGPYNIRCCLACNQQLTKSNMKTLYSLLPIQTHTTYIRQQRRQQQSTCTSNVRNATKQRPLTISMCIVCEWMV